MHSGKDRKVRRKRIQDWSKDLKNPTRGNWTGVMGGLWAFIDGKKHANRRYNKRVRPKDKESHMEVNSYA